MKKILFSASTLSHIMNFHLPYLQEFHNRGYEVWVVADSNDPVPYADHIFAIPFAKSLLSPQNMKAIFLVRKLIKEQSFDIVSTHTTLASAVVRAAILMLPQKPKVFCTVHGYLFHENDSLRKWVFLLPEKICAHVTNVLMVMNHEDYEIAERHHLYKNKLFYIAGMGIDLDKFQPATQEEKHSIRRKAGIPNDDFLFVYAAEFSKRKNQAFLIRAFAAVCTGHPDMKLILAGEGKLLKKCQMLVRKLRLEEQIFFPGYITNMRNLYVACDVCVSSSKIEGLPFNIMEAMACGLPVVASNIKGHRELVEDGETGMMYRNGNEASLRDKLVAVYENPELWDSARSTYRERLLPYELHQAFKQVMKIYCEI